MNKGGLRLLFATTMFLGWIGYLAFLVSNTTRGTDGKPIRLSIPQFLVSEIDLEATETAPGKISVEKVLWVSREDTKPAVGSLLNVPQLDQARGYSQNVKKWLIPLRTRDNGKTFEVVPVPPSPGFSGDKGRIYPALPGVLAQYESLRSRHP